MQPILRPDSYDQIWVYDLSYSNKVFLTDMQAIAAWFNTDPDRAIIADGRFISSYWIQTGDLTRWQSEGQKLTENYYHNLKIHGGGILLATDGYPFANHGMNQLMPLLGLGTFSLDINQRYIPVDTGNPLMTTPNDMGSQLWDDSTTGQAPYGLQPNGRILYAVAWHSGNTDSPGISASFEGVIGLHVDITSPSDGSSFSTETITFVAEATGGQTPYSYAWSSSIDGALGNGPTLPVDASTLSEGTHTIAVVATDPLPRIDDDSIEIAVARDDDDDGVVNLDDLCPDTPAGATVDAKGCAESQMDTDELPEACGESWHIRSSQLRLGEDGTADDGATFPTILPGGAYAAEVVVTNTSGQAAQLVGWIDFGGDGTFEQTGDRSSPDLVNGTPGGPDGDGVFATGNIPTGVTDQTVSLQWTFEGTPPENTYARIRLTTDPAFFSDNSPQPDGTFGPGETEGHELTGNPLPVTLSYFLATPSGDGVHFAWSTATETGNAGFNLYAETEAGRQRLNAELIPSAVIDSVEPQDYAYRGHGCGRRDLHHRAD